MDRAGEARDMVIESVTLDQVCGPTSKLPVHDLPEIALVGRSNVGKSSLINTLVNRKALARTSGTPGKTQTVNYYLVNDEFYLVDLPGYGYARASKSAQDEWADMIERYWQTTQSLTQICQLLDIRHKPSREDLQMYDWVLAGAGTPIIVLTKADKLKRSQIAGAVKDIRAELEKTAVLHTDLTGQTLHAPEPIVFSAKTGDGKDKAWKAMVG